MLVLHSPDGERASQDEKLVSGFGVARILESDDEPDDAVSLSKNADVNRQCSGLLVWGNGNVISGC